MRVLYAKKSYSFLSAGCSQVASFHRNGRRVAGQPAAGSETVRRLNPNPDPSIYRSARGGCWCAFFGQSRQMTGMFPEIDANRHTERQHRTPQAQQDVKSARHGRCFDNADHAGHETAEHSQKHHPFPAAMMRGQIGCQVKRDYLIGGAGTIRATDRASYWKRHPTAERFDVERVPLTTTTMNFYGHHKLQGFQRRKIKCMGCAKWNFL